MTLLCRNSDSLFFSSSINRSLDYANFLKCHFQWFLKCLQCNDDCTVNRGHKGHNYQNEESFLCGSLRYWLTYNSTKGLVIYGVALS